MALGRTWTTLIVIQVAVAVAGVPVAIALSWSQIRDQFSAPAFAVDQMLVAPIALGESTAVRSDAAARFATLRTDLSRQLAAESDIAGHAFTLDFPTSGISERVEMENSGADTSKAARRDVVRSTVDDRFFRTLDLTVLAGRTFDRADAATGADDVVVVNRAFAAQRVPGGSPLGRRIRYADIQSPAAAPDSARWYEVVGVVEDIDANPFHDGLTEPRVYHPLKDATAARVHLIVRMASIPAATAARLRQLTARVSPALVVDDVITFAEIYRLRRTGMITASVGIAVGLLSVLLLSAAGIYALMSFTVTQRRREIAIRTALGAQPGRLLGGIFRHALKQIAIGVAFGVAVALLLDFIERGEALQGYRAILLSGMVLVMSAVGLLATLGPARRGLRIEPVEALRAE
jgi:hypothetical protein